VQNKANFQVPEMSLTCGQKMGYDGKLLKEVMEKQSQFPGLGWFTRLRPAGQGPAGPRNAVVHCYDVRPTIVAVGCASSHDFFRRAGTLALPREISRSPTRATEVRSHVSAREDGKSIAFGPGCGKITGL